VCECASPVSCPRMSWFSVGGMKGMNRTSLTWPLSKQGIYYLLTSYNDKSTMESERDYNIKKEREIETVSSWWTNKRQKKIENNMDNLRYSKKKYLSTGQLRNQRCTHFKKSIVGWPPPIRTVIEKQPDLWIHFPNDEINFCVPTIKRSTRFAKHLPELTCSFSSVLRISKSRRYDLQSTW
jgi:hypothetical protein